MFKVQILCVVTHLIGRGEFGIDTRGALDERTRGDGVGAEGIAISSFIIAALGVAIALVSAVIVIVASAEHIRSRARLSVLGAARCRKHRVATNMCKRLFINGDLQTTHTI